MNVGVAGFVVVCMCVSGCGSVCVSVDQYMYLVACGVSVDVTGFVSVCM